MSDITGDNLNIYGGDASAGTGAFPHFGEGDGVSGLSSGHSGPFETEYTLIASTAGSLKRVNLTFCNYNDPHEARIFNSSLNVIKQADTMEKLDLVDFFYPVQDFSGYQKQTFVIGTESSINLDPGDFDTTLGEVGLLMATAEYNAEATEDQEILYWHYKGIERYVMGKFMVLTGQVKNGYTWKGWEVHPDVSEQVGYTGAATGGFVFSNPTEYPVKLTILTAS